MIKKEIINHYSTTEAQRKAFKKYSEKITRINVVLSKDKVFEIDDIIRYYGHYSSRPEFIRDAINYYIEKIKDGEITL